MYGGDAARGCAEHATYADDSIEAAPDQSKWISTEAEAGTYPPTIAEILGEIEGRVDALASQLETLTDGMRCAGPGDASRFDYLLDQFRILTFTVGGAMSRHINSDTPRIPVGQLQSILNKFVGLADILSHEAGRVAQRDGYIDEIQRQSRSVSQRIALVIERLCGSKATDFLDNLEAMIGQLESVTADPAAETTIPTELLGTRLGEVLAQFEDAVHQANQFAVYSDTFHDVAERAIQAIGRLLEQPDFEPHVVFRHLLNRFDFAVTQFAVRANNAAMSKRSSR